MRPVVAVKEIFSDADAGEQRNPTAKGYRLLAEAGPETWDFWWKHDGNAAQCVPEFSGVKFERAVDFAAFSTSVGSSFPGARFPAGTSFSGLEFSDDADFSGAVFEGEGVFERCRFDGEANFTAVRFVGGVNFNRSVFRGSVYFGPNSASNSPPASIGEGPSSGQTDCGFVGCRFLKDVCFRAVRFVARTDFSDSTFEGQSSFEGAAFELGANFARTTFDGLSTSFFGTNFGATSTFLEATLHWVSFEQSKFGDSTCFASAKLDSVSFDATKFGEVASFELATFCGNEGEIVHLFDWSTFGGGATFRGANWSGPLSFRGALFKGSVDFSGTPGKQLAFDGVDFSGSVFGGRASFSHRKIFKFARFGRIPEADRRRESDAPSQFKVPPQFHGCSLPETNSIAQAVFLGADEPGAIEDFRALKKLMNDLHAHRDEAKFFRLELDAERAQEKRPSVWLLYSLYHLLSKFGESVWRPTALLLGTLLAFSGVYAVQAGLKPGGNCELAVKVLAYSLVKALPLLGMDRSSNDLWSDLAGECSSTGGGHILTVASHRVISILAIFLIGLGLRNRFRVK